MARRRGIGQAQVDNAVRGYVEAPAGFLHFGAPQGDEFLARIRDRARMRTRAIGDRNDRDVLMVKPADGNKAAPAKAAAEKAAKDDTRSLRVIMAHMIEETARHAGQADILREQIDGVTND